MTEHVQKTEIVRGGPAGASIRQGPMGVKELKKKFEGGEQSAAKNKSPIL